MNKELKKKRKQILSDPFRFFTSLHADTDSQLITRLENLSQQHKDLKSRYNEAQLRKNIISRQIGEAKHNGVPLDDLKATMVEQGARLKTIADEHAVEQQLFSFFDLAERPAAMEKDANQVCTDRNYPARETNPDIVSVSRLEDQHD